MSPMFHDQVALVTGAGNGLGRAHALALAARGAKVVVNDLGAARDGRGASSVAAQKVVDAIVAQGGEALADSTDVTDEAAVNAMVERALDTFGRVDILINSAGILRDKTFHKLTADDFRAVFEVHVMGAFHCTRAVWPQMRQQRYGRVLMTTSSSGLYGNFGQANYAAAKMALVGLMNTLHLEGAKYDIKVNALAPVAVTRMTEDLLPGSLSEMLKPELVSPGALLLVAEGAPSGVILAAGGGVFARVRIVENDGIVVSGSGLALDQLAQRWDEIDDPRTARALAAGPEQTRKVLLAAAKALGVDLSGGA